MESNQDMLEQQQVTPGDPDNFSFQGNNDGDGGADDDNNMDDGKSEGSRFTTGNSFNQKYALTDRAFQQSQLAGNIGAIDDGLKLLNLVINGRNLKSFTQQDAAHIQKIMRQANETRQGLVAFTTDFKSFNPQIDAGVVDTLSTFKKQSAIDLVSLVDTSNYIVNKDSNSGMLSQPRAKAVSLDPIINQLWLYDHKLSGALRDQAVKNIQGRGQTFINTDDITRTFTPGIGPSTPSIPKSESTFSREIMKPSDAQGASYFTSSPDYRKYLYGYFKDDDYYNFYFNDKDNLRGPLGDLMTSASQTLFNDSEKDKVVLDSYSEAWSQVYLPLIDVIDLYKRGAAESLKIPNSYTGADGDISQQMKAGFYADNIFLGDIPKTAAAVVRNVVAGKGGKISDITQDDYRNATLASLGGLVSEILMDKDKQRALMIPLRFAPHTVLPKEQQMLQPQYQRIMGTNPLATITGATETQLMLSNLAAELENVVRFEPQYVNILSLPKETPIFNYKGDVFSTATSIPGLIRQFLEANDFTINEEQINNSPFISIWQNKVAAEVNGGSGSSSVFDRVFPLVRFDAASGEGPTRQDPIGLLKNAQVENTVFKQLLDNIEVNLDQIRNNEDIQNLRSNMVKTGANKNAVYYAAPNQQMSDIDDAAKQEVVCAICSSSFSASSLENQKFFCPSCKNALHKSCRGPTSEPCPMCQAVDIGMLETKKQVAAANREIEQTLGRKRTQLESQGEEEKFYADNYNPEPAFAIQQFKPPVKRQQRGVLGKRQQLTLDVASMALPGTKLTQIPQLSQNLLDNSQVYADGGTQGLNVIGEANKQQESGVDFNMRLLQGQVLQPTPDANLINSSMGAFPVTRQELDTTKKVLQFVSKNVEGDLIADMGMQTQMKQFIAFANSMNNRLTGQKTKQILLSEKVRSAGESVAEAIVRNEQNLVALQRNTEELGNVQQQLTQFKDIDQEQRKQVSDIKTSTTRLQTLSDKIQDSMNNARFGATYDKEVLLNDVGQIVGSLPTELAQEKADLNIALSNFQSQPILNKESSILLSEQLLDVLARLRKIQNIREKTLGQVNDTGIRIGKLKTRLKDLEMDAGVAVQQVNETFTEMGFPQYTSQYAGGSTMVDFMKIFKFGTEELKVKATQNAGTISTFDKQATALDKLHTDFKLQQRELRKIVIDSLNNGINSDYFGSSTDLADAAAILTQLNSDSQAQLNVGDVNRLLEVMSTATFNLKSNKYDSIGNKEKIQRYQTDVKKADEALARVNAQYLMIREEAKQTNDDLKRRGIIGHDFLLDRDFQLAELDQLRTELQERQLEQSDDKFRVRMKLADTKQLKSEITQDTKELASDRLKIESILNSMKNTLAKTSYDAKAENISQLNLDDIRGELLKINDEIAKKAEEKTLTQETYLELMRQNILLKDQKADLTKQKTIAESESVRKERRMLENILAQEAITQIKDQEILYETTLMEIAQGNYENAQKTLGIPTNVMNQITGDIQTFTKYYMDAGNTDTAKKLYITRNLDKDGDINNFFNKQLKQMSTLGAIRTPAFQPMISEIQEANSVTLSALYKNLAIYTFSDEIGTSSMDDKDALGGEAQKQLTALIPATRVFESAVNKIVLLDIRYQNTLLNGGALSQRNLQDMMVVSRIQGAVDTIISEVKSLKQMTTTEKTLTLQKINGFSSNLGEQFDKVEKLLVKIGDKNIVLQQRQKIDDIAYNVVENLISSGNLNRQQQVSKIEGGGMRALSTAMGDIMQRGALNYVMGDGNNQNAIQDNQNRLFAILSENNILNQADSRIAAQNLVAFLKDSSDEFKDTFSDKLAQITSKQFADIYMDIDTKKVGEMMANKKQARLFIQGQVGPSDSGRLDQISIADFNASGMVRQVAEQSEIINDIISYNRSNLRSTQLAGEILERGTYKRAGKKSSLVFLGAPIDGQENSKDDLSIVSLAMKQQQIYSLPVENLNKERKIVDKERANWQKAAVEYKLAVDEQSAQSMGRMVGDLLSYITINGIPNGAAGRRYNTYMSFDFNVPDPFSMLSLENTAGLAYDFFKNQKHIVASITAPIYDKMENGVIPSKSDLLRVRGLEQINDFLRDQYYRYENTFIEKRVNADGEQLDEPALSNGDYFFGNNPRKGVTDGIDFTGIQNTMGEYLRRTRDVMVQYTQGYVDKNMAFLDKVDALIDTRAKEETDVDKYKKTNEKVEKYSKGLQGHIEGMLLKQGLKGFFDTDKPSQQMVRTAQQQMLPRFFDPAARGQQQSQNGGLVSQQQSQQVPQQPFMAYQGSEAEQTGDSQKSRLNANAIKVADGFSQITKEDIGFIQQIRYDTERKTLLFYAEADDSAKGGRALTKDEKRRYIRILVILLLNLYISQVKNLSREKRNRTEGKLLNKYIGSGDTTPLISMVNKLADKAASINENHEKRTSNNE